MASPVAATSNSIIEFVLLMNVVLFTVHLQQVVKGEVGHPPRESPG
jgi:hypothetical protein